MDDFETLPIFPPETDFESAQHVLAEAEQSDGLPLVMPTRERLDNMLANVSAPERSYGFVAPLYGEITPVSVAYQCLMAGCGPSHLPVVLAALQACIDEKFNLLGIATTTGTPAVAVMVHGSVASELGMNDSTNCIGPGNRANAVIGRAVALCLRNIGGARAGVGDMATMGQPGKYGFCFAENRDRLLPSFVERSGFRPEEPAVSVFGVSGTAEMLPASQDSPEAILTPIAASLWGSQLATGGFRERDFMEQVVLFPPELVHGITKHGWDLPRAQAFIHEARPFAINESVAPWDYVNARGLTRAPEDIHLIVTGGPGVKMTHLPLWAGGTRPITLRLPSL